MQPTLVQNQYSNLKEFVLDHTIIDICKIEQTITR
jgi:hypothetical protein